MALQPQLTTAQKSAWAGRFFENIGGDLISHLDNHLAHRSGTETFTGDKTFSGSLTLSGANTFSGVNTFSAGIRLADGADVRFANTSGAKLGTATTNKLAFWGRPPVVCAASLQTGYTGNSDAVDMVIARLKDAGIMMRT